MRITCLITVCAYLSSTVSTDEIQYSNRPRRVRTQEESVLDDATARKELNPNRGTRPDVYPLRNSRSHRQIETYQKPFQKKTSESQPRPQQHPRDRSRRPIKRLKVRSIDGSTYEVDDNEVHEFHEIHESIPEVHDEGPIYIKPVVRVTTKNNNVFDSILEILSQLLDPPKKELGPIVGPIKMPGTKRNVYLRLLEPVDSSHINVRFVTQVPVPVVDEESILSREHQSVLPFLPYGDLSTTLLHQHHYASGDATFSSSNRHHSVQLPRNASHVSGKGRKLQPKPATKVKRPPPEELKETDEKTVKPVKETVSEGESNKNNLYYQYQSEDDAVKEVSEIIKGATKNGQGSENSLEHQLTTHRLPYRQIAPLYPLSVMEHTDSGSYQNTYTVPSDSHASPTPSTYSNYEQYGNVNAEPSGYYDQSSYTIPNTYATTYQKQNEFSNAPSSYPISYQNHNEFTNAPSSTSYVKQNDLYSAPTSHTSSYEKPASVPPTSSSYATSYEAPNGIQTGSSSQNALRVIDPPLYFLDPPKFSENHANKVYEHPAIQPQPYSLPNANEISSLRNTAQNGKVPIDQVTWGKVKREKGESNFQKNELNFQKSVEVTSDSNREKWQPLMFVPEDTDWQKAVANLAKVANGNHEVANGNYEVANGNHEIVYGNHYHEAIARQPSVNRPRQVSPEGTIEFERLVEQRQRGKRRNHSAASTQNSKCSTSNRGENCERTEPTIVSTPLPESTINIVEAAQLTANTEAIVTKSVASTTVEMSRPNATKSSWIEEPQALVMTTESLATSSTTEKSPLLIKVMKSTTEKSITENKTTTSGSMKSNVTEKSGWIASSTTERLPISSTLKGLIPRNNTMKRPPLPKRPMIMKKPTFVLKNAESSSTTRRTVASSTRKPTTRSTTEKTKTTRRMKFQGAKTKSSTT